MTLKSITLLVETERAIEREVTETKIAALHDLRWEFCRILDDLIANEEQKLNQDPDKYS